MSLRYLAGYPRSSGNVLSEIQRSAANTTKNPPFGRRRRLWDATHRSGDILFTRFATVVAHTIPTLKQLNTDETNVLRFHPRLLSDPDPSSTHSVTLPYETLYILTRELFGRSYIYKIGRNREGPGVLLITLTSPVIRGVRFALGRFGLRAIRVLYDDGSRSPWLGDPSGCWFGNEPARLDKNCLPESTLEDQLLSLVTTGTVCIKIPRRMEWKLAGVEPTCSSSR